MVSSNRVGQRFWAYATWLFVTTHLFLVWRPALELTMDRTPSPVSPRLMRTPQRATLSPKGARARELTLPSPPWGRGAGGEGVYSIVRY